MALLPSSPAVASRGDFLPAGTGYCASTYAGHPRPFPKELWGPSVDLNEDGGDWGRHLLAPGDGKVLVWTTVERTYGGRAHEGWGNSLVWISADGREQLFVGHLSRILVRWPQERVRSGRVIGLAGNTGEVGGSGSDGGAHLHVNRMVGWKPAPVILSGRTIVPSSSPGANCGSGPNHYVSAGPGSSPLRCGATERFHRRPVPAVADPDGRVSLQRPRPCAG
jgi:Peptidase family M23